MGNNKISAITLEALDNEEYLKDGGFCCVIGVDEAGRGPLAGPVVAAAVILHEYNFEHKITDSKKLSPRQRQKAFHEIYQKGTVGIGVMNETVIDEHNILQATFLAMSSAVMQVVARQQAMDECRYKDSDICLLIDGNRFNSDLPYYYQTIVKGDARVASIACASIVAKVTRDRILGIYDRIFPVYGFKQHKGYPTKAHKEVIKAQGPTFIHRRSFRWE